jgi:ribosomal protein S18 acetylase RimI-like enzyme
MVTFQCIKTFSEIAEDILEYIALTDLTQFPTPWTKIGFTDFFKTHDFFLVLVLKNNVMVGFSLFETTFADSFAHLLKIVIDKNERNLGVGKDLLDCSLKELKKNNIKKYFLEVNENNASAIQVYKSLGFLPIHVNKNFYGAGLNAIVMTHEED